MPQINQCRLSTPSCPPPPFSRCIITKITIMKILSASQPPPPHFPLPLFRPPTHCLAHSRRRKFIKMKLRLQFSGFIKIYLPLTDVVCSFVCFSTEDKRDSLNNLVSFISNILWTCIHEYDFSHKIQTLVDYAALPSYCVELKLQVIFPTNEHIEETYVATGSTV